MCKKIGWLMYAIRSLFLYFNQDRIKSKRRTCIQKNFEDPQKQPAGRKVRNEEDEGKCLLRIDNGQFIDREGRIIMLRGINLGGSSKIPVAPNGATHLTDSFYEHRTVSFVGRPFPVSEADEHFTRLRRWGFTFLRFLVTWEAIEHAGPGIYDEDYLEYIREIAVKAGEYSISLFIDPHQDVWSRFSGGDGAPGWTLEAVGFELPNLHKTGAAVIHHEYGEDYPRILWPTNANKLASATMFTMFLGGNDFAPKTRVDSEPVQEYLQRHYINAIRQVAKRLAGLPQVVGYETMNEPSHGYIGWQDLNSNEGVVELGESPTPFQSMLLGEGFPQETEVWKLGLFAIRRNGSRWLNTGRARAWKEGCGCIWKDNGVWDMDAAGMPHLLRADYFSRVKGHKVNYTQEYLVPFARRFAEGIRSADPGASIFFENVAGDGGPEWDADFTSGVVYTPHWYDGIPMVMNLFTPFIGVNFFNHKIVLGSRAVRRSYAGQLARLKQDARVGMHGAPVLLGEFGIPFDLEHKKAYRNGNYKAQENALERSFKAVEDNLLNSTLWNYTADNDNVHGDLWNNEDCSIFSRDQQTHPEDINSGGRALPAVVRPYPRATAGEAVKMSFDAHAHVFIFEFCHDSNVEAPTVVFLPKLHYPVGCRVEVSDGRYELNLEEQELLYWHDASHKIHKIVVKPARRRERG